MRQVVLLLLCYCGLVNYGQEIFFVNESIESEGVWYSEGAPITGDLFAYDSQMQNDCYCTYKGSFVNGLANGLSQRWHLNNVLAEEGYYQNGKKQGVFKEWNPAGRLESERVYEQAKLVSAKTYYPSGYLAEEKNYEMLEGFAFLSAIKKYPNSINKIATYEMSFENGEPHGEELTRSPEGLPKLKRIFDHGLLLSETRYNQGAIEEKVKYYKDLYQIELFNPSNGKPKESGFYNLKSANRDREWIFYDENGIPLMEIHYDDGKELMKGFYKNGKKDGVWKEKGLEGNTQIWTEYDEGKIVKSTSFRSSDLINSFFEQTGRFYRYKSGTSSAQNIVIYNDGSSRLSDNHGNAYIKIFSKMVEGFEVVKTLSEDELQFVDKRIQVNNVEVVFDENEMVDAYQKRRITYRCILGLDLALYSHEELIDKKHMSFEGIVISDPLGSVSYQSPNELSLIAFQRMLEKVQFQAFKQIHFPFLNTN